MCNTMESRKSKLLLHVCCAPCSTHVIQLLSREFEVTLFFYNPNIHPEQEYIQRLEDARRYAENVGIGLIEGAYEREKWFKFIKGFENEKEGGKRCEECFRMRLSRTAEKGVEIGSEFFTTTLTISPHKDARLINAIGREISNTYTIKFYEADFKKKDGFKRSVELSKKAGLRRQNYCGCIFSMRNRKSKC